MKPIICTTESVMRILDRSKTQTRRVIKLRDGSLPQDEEMSCDENGKVITVMDFSKIFPQWQELKCPYGIPGDKLWVGETWATDGAGESGKYDFMPPSELPDGINIFFKASIKTEDEWRIAKWRPSRNMPKWASRITLEIKDVRVERVQDIKPIDAVREGCPAYLKYEDVDIGRGLKPVETRSPREQFERLWNSINLKRGYGWDSNLYVWVVEFEKI